MVTSYRRDRCASMALSLMLLLLSNNVYATTGDARNRFRVHDQPLNRRRAGKAEHVKAHHGGGRGHHRDQPPVAVVVSESVISSKETLATAETLSTPAPIEVVSTTAVDVAVVSESVAVSSGGKSGKASAAADVPQSLGEEVVAPTEMSPSDATVENTTDAEEIITMMTKQTLPDANNTDTNATDMPSTIVLSGGSVAKSGKSAGGGASVIITESNATGVPYPAIDVSGGSGAKSGKLAGGEGNVTRYGSKVSKTYTGEPDADIVKPKASKVNQPLTEFFIKVPTPPAKPKSGKSAGVSVSGVSDMEATGGKSGKYATGGKSSKTNALTSMSYDYDGDSGGMSGTIYDVLKADQDFSTFVGAVDTAGITAILNLPGLTVTAPTNEAFDALEVGLLDTLLLPENIKLLQDVLGYHIIAASLPSASLTSGDFTTLSGDTVSVVVSDTGISFNDANVIMPDIIASNGVIHGIDAVLVPPEGSGSITTGPPSTPPPVAVGLPTLTPGGVLGLPTPPPQLLTLPPTPALGVPLPTLPPGAVLGLLTLPPQVTTLPPTLPPGSTAPPNVLRSPPYGSEATYPTYSPTGNDDTVQLVRSSEGGNTIAIEPFGLKLVANSAAAKYDEEMVTLVTEEHLIHSFRTQGYVVESLKLMVLERERRLFSEHNPTATDPISLRFLEQHPEHELIYGGVLHFAADAEKKPSKEDMDIIIQNSFSGERSTYYVELLQEKGIEVNKADLDMKLVPVSKASGGDAEGFNWAGLTIGLSSVLAGIGILGLGSRYMKRRQLSIDDLDLGKENYTIRLQYTNDELDRYPATAAETVSSRDQLSVPSLIQGIEDEVNFQTTPGGTNSYLIGKNKGKGSKEGRSGGKNGQISPLESPMVASDNTSQASSPRYISVFTVKKDCGGKTLDQINLRDLIISYLSRMMKKLPNTHLLPYDKKSTLPAIINIRSIPDDITELQHYVGNAHVDDKTGKVMFNLRVEGDQPVSKMKSNDSGDGKLGLSNKLKTKSNTVSPIAKAASQRKAPESPVDSDSIMENVASPITPASMEDVDL